MVTKVMEDISYVVLLRRKFTYLESIPGVLLPHPSSAAFPTRMDGCNASENWPAIAPSMEFYDHFSPQVGITPSMSSLEALLSKLPPVGPAPSGSSTGYYEMPPGLASAQRPPMGLVGVERVAKEEMEEHGNGRGMDLGGENSSSMSSYLNATKPREE
ncbi:putative protein RICE SALT SENSITIVE 3 [Cocos nucifera]|uniref:Uncharacterized protein n=1 Tax=Cocos nucifera TaxID=13894 RepID=A0A8K0IR73_COCNU|nr:putative protein RICE SALT SENSITIVE 3 [Cocos nucifera]